MCITFIGPSPEVLELTGDKAAAVAAARRAGVPTLEELPELAAEASREALSAFGDARVYLERAVINPQHIEAQILADQYGNVIHLFERDCSLQRRHQKVVEIAPAQHISAELRDRICNDAVRFSKEIGDVGAGTVEFLVDEADNYVFIEMNPRIQVEHTVTEEITGVDLVKSQMRIAAGHALQKSV